MAGQTEIRFLPSVCGLRNMLIHGLDRASSKSDENFIATINKSFGFMACLCCHDAWRLKKMITRTASGVLVSSLQ